MRDRWYADNRDLVKWAILTHLATMMRAKYILQIAYYRPDEFPSIKIDDESFDIPKPVLSHFRSIYGIEELALSAKIRVFPRIIRDRQKYVEEAKGFISSFSNGKRLVFLDPDTGLEPARPSLNHVLNDDLRFFGTA